MTDEITRQYIKSRNLNVLEIRQITPRPARYLFDGMLELLARRTPEPPLGFERWGLPRIAYTAHFLRQYVSAGSRVVDLASGAIFSQLVSNSLPSVVWLPVDGEFEQKEFHDKQDGSLQYKYDPTQLMLKDERITFPSILKPDIVTLFEVVEHLAWNPAPLFGSVSDWLAVGGRFILSTPNLCSLPCIMRQLLGGTPHQVPFFKEGLWYHKKEYSPWEMKLLFQWAGFEIESNSYGQRTSF